MKLLIAAILLAGVPPSSSSALRIPKLQPKQTRAPSHEILEVEVVLANGRKKEFLVHLLVK